MLFGLEEDAGHALRCFVIPDAGGTTPSVTLKGGGREIAVVEANRRREDLVKSGRHATGQCGFDINETIVPDLATYADLEVRDVGSGLLIYRRAREAMATMKVFRLETHLLPLRRFDNALQDRFQYWYGGLDRLGLETSLQAFSLANSSSLYLSGHFLLTRLSEHLDESFKKAVLFRDPYRELAERLLLFKNLAEGSSVIDERDLFAFKDIIGLVRTADRLDEKACRDLFRRTPTPVLAPLANPFARQLACDDLEEKATSRSVAGALQSLAGFDVVALRDDAAFFSATFADLIGAEAESLPVMHDYVKVVELGDILRNIRKAEALLEHDLEIYEHVKHAFAAVPDDGGTVG